LEEKRINYEKVKRSTPILNKPTPPTLILNKISAMILLHKINTKKSFSHPKTKNRIDPTLPQSTPPKLLTIITSPKNKKQKSLYLTNATISPERKEKKTHREL